MILNAAIDYANILMTQRISYDGSNAQYIGFAAAGTKEGQPLWMIQRLTYSSDLMTRREFAGGNANFDKRWTKRTEYNYA